ncbi:MAG: ADP-ribosylation factor-like protein [Candidatus Hodarchaeales archaeon]|jgi:small GTP-binding protein
MFGSKDANKIVILGLAESGKSTIIKTVKEGKPPSSIKAPYTATMNYERSQQTIFGKQLTLFDLGGQTSFLDRFTGELAEFVFSDVKAFIFVVDITKFEEVARSKYYFDLCLKNLDKHSPSAYKYIFLHKTDLVKEKMVPDIKASMEEFLTKDYTREITYYPTSVFNQELHKVMGEIYSKVSEVYTSYDPFLKNFIEENKNLVLRGQIFSADGKSLTDLSQGQFSNKFSLKKVFESLVLLGASLNDGVQSNVQSVLLEQDKSLFVLKISDKGFILVMEYDRAKILESGETVSSISSKVDSLNHQLGRITIVSATNS